MSKTIKYSLVALVTVFVLYFSLDIQRLDKHRAFVAPALFNATDFAARFWEDGLESAIAEAPPMTDVLKALNENPQKAFESYGKKLGISKTDYFLVKGEGVMEKVTDEYILLGVGENAKIKIATDFIFGNAVRDGSGKVNIDEFLNMTDFNAVSVAINKLVKEKVVARLKQSAKEGKQLEFAGAFEISEENVDLSAILVLPVSVKISDGKSE